MRNIGMMRLLILAVALSLLILIGGYQLRANGFSPLTPPATFDPSEIRGVWVQEKVLRQRSTINHMLDQAVAGGFNAIFVCVFADGRTLYQSDLAEMSERVTPGFNPLAYLVPEAHSRGIAVHAWFVVGLVGERDESPVLAAHPEWGLAGPDGETTGWLNFTRPDVRRYMSDLMLEVVQRYDVDGIHFDYARYPGGTWGFDPYSIELFNREHSFDLNQLRYADLPAYGRFDGNPLVDPGTAEVLASFTNGLPAVTLNHYGEGETLLLNWNASERNIAVGSEIIQRGIVRLLDAGGTVYLLRSETNAETYGFDDFMRVLDWIDQLGWPLEATSEAQISSLSADSVLVLPNVYIISAETAAALADFVHRGGGLIIIDGPTKSIGLHDLQTVTGMQGRGRYFKQTMLLFGVEAHPLVPSSKRNRDLAGYQARDKAWKTFRARGISLLIGEVYRRVKSADAGVVVSVTITSDQAQAANESLQDWAAWLAGGYVDMLIPRGYVDEAQDLRPIIADWHALLQNDDRITLGLKVFSADGKAAVVKSPRQLMAEIGIAHNAGSNGIMLFDIDRMSDAQLHALAAASGR